ncbi:MAG TPA: class I SAM-dependent methyltransferase [Ideonella sp.]|nr:class I SAM-dependent methyltransferase [Ideonella sp.]
MTETPTPGSIARMPPTIGPQARYRDRLLQEVLSHRPSQVLEVGSGSGAFLRSAASSGPKLQGIDPDASSVRKLREEGFDVQVGVAESLPFEAESIDLVVFSYTAHHIANWPAALSEALRVSRRGVVVLDPWYDERIPSQATALAFDRWCKRIDRANGMVHNDCLDAQALLGADTLARPGLRVKYEYMLALSELGVPALEEAATAQLAAAQEPERWRLALAGILNAAQATGYSDDGAILLAITKYSEA